MQPKDNPLIRKLLSLDLPAEDYVIAGSGPLFAHGIKNGLGDLDVVARGRAWQKATTFAPPEPAPFWTGVDRVLLFDGEIEIFNGWFPELGTVDELISRSDLIDGLRYESLHDVVRWKRTLDRQKDRDDIKLIDQHRTNGSPG
ncbi:hypothetical protein HNP84_010213 [Thermocatellispora tengchongensis]|uniref:Uncharacterized protein n=1 Tax=Thermocatellispora tengchongensis TaxID=1073253 RepID=A0A840PNK0_9ACTN|nr:hypothetical protein [Thermocatellispora tengchongensis]MBB5140446.1 hypothetical protein [Thermocatellispora tengchongensis]